MLEVHGLGIEFGGVRALDDVSFRAEPGGVLSVIGPNGAGKTTLFNLVSGMYRSRTGRVTLEGRDVTGAPAHVLARSGLSRTFQNLQVFFQMTALENVMVGCHVHERRGLLAHLLGLPSTGRQNAASCDTAWRLLGDVGLESYADMPAGAMPYGALKRLEIARALASRPTVLLLDEPAAGCNPSETAELDRIIRRIAAAGVCIVLVEHDIGLVMSLSQRIVVLNYGRKLAEGSPAEIQCNAEVIAAYLGGQADEEVSNAVGA
ncbi:MAG: ABC transporter ATP-binding protein [Burkholderiaceae bacterium]